MGVMTLVDRLARLHEHAAQHCVSLDAPLPACTLFFSVSDAAARAEVLHSSAASFAEAWKQGLIRLRQRMARRKLNGRWLRVDWVEEARAMPWREFEARLAVCRRNYFRYGLALDEAFRIILTEQECNANAVFYGGADISHAVFNGKNFARYAARRFSGADEPPFDPERQVWQIATAGVFCDRDGELHALPGPLPRPEAEPSAAPVAGDALHAGLNCGRRQVDQLSVQDVSRLIADSGDWLARQIQPDGRFVYGYFPCFDRRIKTYNSLRHASSAYALLEAWEYTGNAAWEGPIRRALECLVKRFIREYTLPDGTSAAYLVDDEAGEIKLGGNGVSLLALTKWMEITGSREFLDVLEKLALGIAGMQRPDGTFVHVLRAEDLSLKEAFRIVYYDGEAVFGLLRAYGLTKDPRWLSMAEKAFDAFLADDHWKAHDHWLSYSVNELTRYRPEERYFRFGIKNFIDHLGFVLTRETTYPTLLELMMAARGMLARLEGMPELRHLLDEVDREMFYRALHHRAHYLLNGFFWPELAMYYQNPASVVGAFFIRHHAFRARIDDTEHYLSGLVAYADFLRQEPAGADPV